MHPRKAPTGPETDADKIVDAIKQFTKTVDQRLEILGDEASRLADECKWMVNQLRDLFGRRPIARQREIHEIVTCSGGCDETIDSVVDAVREGWTELLADPDGTSWDFLGVCPSCNEQSMFEKPAAPVPPENPDYVEPPKAKKSTLF